MVLQLSRTTTLRRASSFSSIYTQLRARQAFARARDNDFNQAANLHVLLGASRVVGVRLAF